MHNKNSIRRKTVYFTLRVPLCGFFLIQEPHSESQEIQLDYIVKEIQDSGGVYEQF